MRKILYNHQMVLSLVGNLTMHTHKYAIFQGRFEVLIGCDVRYNMEPVCLSQRTRYIRTSAGKYSLSPPTFQNRL